MAVRRYDVGSTRKPTKLPSGFLRCDGYLTRTGVFLYRDDNGKEVRELRHPDDVFDAEALASFALVPFTNNHPAGMVTAKNAKTVTVGTVGERIEREDRYVRAALMITDAGAIEEFERGKVELSCGYSCDLEWGAGEYEGEKYDARQRKIRGNHVALVDRGRAGPQVRIHLDAGDATMDGLNRAQQESEMRKIKINGIEFEVSEQAAQAFEVERTATQGRIDALASQVEAGKKSVDTLQAKLDVAEEKVKTITTKLDDATNPEKIQARVAARASLEKIAVKAGLELEPKELAKLDDDKLRLRVVEKVTGKKFDGKSPEYIAARWDAAVESLASDNEEERVDEEERARETQFVRDARPTERTTGGRRVDEARKKAAESDRDLWKKTLPAA